MNLKEFYCGKKILITGHTGFKGSWLCKILKEFGADIVGYSLQPPTEPSLFNILNIEKDIVSIIGDISDLEKLKETFNKYEPELVIHLAAQPIVRESYKNPVGTYQTNVMGTVNILECIRTSNSVKSFLNVTTDKVYFNKEWDWGYRECDELNGFDPYSNSKSCSELVTQSYKNSFFNDRNIAISTARAGNVIGGGDFASDRIIPDCIRAVKDKKDIIVRNPYSTRPYQHVLEPLFAYLLILAKQYEDISYSGNYNVGPDDNCCYKTGDLVNLFVSEYAEGAKWVNKSDGGPHEANFLKLDCSKLKNKFGWSPTWTLSTSMKKIIEWSKAYIKGASSNELNEIINKQISEFIEDSGNMFKE